MEVKKVRYFKIGYFKNQLFNKNEDLAFSTERQKKVECNKDYSSVTNKNNKTYTRYKGTDENFKRDRKIGNKKFENKRNKTRQ